MSDFECDGLPFAIIGIDPAYERPVRFSGSEFIRIGENKRRLAEFPEHERALWLGVGRRRFESAVAEANVAPDSNSFFLSMLYPRIPGKVALHAVSENRASAQGRQPPHYSPPRHVVI